jgi:hypothetical protein
VHFNIFSALRALDKVRYSVGLLFSVAEGSRTNDDIRSLWLINHDRVSTNSKVTRRLKREEGYWYKLCTKNNVGTSSQI